MTDLNKIVEDLSKLTVVEAAELSKTLEEKWGVTAAAPVAVAAAGAAGAGAPDLASLMAQMGAMGGSPSPAASTQPPEERFASQLIQLGDMG